MDPRLSRLLVHVEHVRDDCQRLGEALIERGEGELGRHLIALGRRHDESKFTGFEWAHLGVPGDPLHREAWRYHVAANPHHPEFYGAGGIHDMPRVYVAEMVADWKSRSNECCGSLREWIETKGRPRFGFVPGDAVDDQVREFLSLIAERPFD